MAKEKNNETPKEEVKKEPNYNKRYYVWKTIDILICIIPLIVYASINFNKYFGTKTTTLSNALGFGMLIGVLVIILVKKTQVLNGFLGLIIAELILVFLDVYVQDLKFILGMAIIGIAVASFTTHPLVKKYRRLRDKKETASENALALDGGIERIVEAIKGKGRA